MNERPRELLCWFWFWLSVFWSPESLPSLLFTVFSGFTRTSSFCCGCFAQFFPSLFISIFSPSFNTRENCVFPVTVASVCLSAMLHLVNAKRKSESTTERRYPLYVSLPPISDVFSRPLVFSFIRILSEK